MKNFLHTLHHLFLGTAVVLYTALALAAAIATAQGHFIVSTPVVYDWSMQAANLLLLVMGAIGAWGFWLLCCDLETKDQLAAFELETLERNAIDDELSQHSADFFGAQAQEEMLAGVSVADPYGIGHPETHYEQLYGPEIMLLLGERYPARFHRPSGIEEDEFYADQLIARHKEEQFPNY